MSNIPIDEEYESILKQKLFTTHPDLYNDKDFNKIIETSKISIEDKTLEDEMFIMVNKKLSNDFTYKDLKDEILQVYVNVSKGRRMKFNIRFGLIIRNIVTKKYQYYYRSYENLFILDGKKIITRSDIKTIIKELYNMNIAEHYRMLLPSPSYKLVSITNVHFELFSSSYLRSI